jgi:uncharacterized phage-associated protein
MSPNSPYDSRAVANFLLDRADALHRSVTQLILYKVIYFSHGWYLAAHSRPLVFHEFEAWQYGPVIKVLRDQFQDFEDRPITSRAEKLNILTGEYTVVPSELREEDGAFIGRIFASYLNYSAWELSNLTHEPGSPWDRLWNSEKPVGRLALRIKNEEIKAHFDGLAKRLRIL